MGTKLDLTGQIFNGIKLIKDTKKRYRGKSSIWLCECHCGKIFEAIGAKIKSGHKKSCGCKKNISKRKPKDRTGNIVNGIEFIENTFEKKGIYYIWLCKCYCGKIFKANGTDVQKGDIRSCGCNSKSRHVKDWSGNIFHGIEILEDTGKRDDCAIFNCKCHCGKIFQAKPSRIKSKDLRSCGCSPKRDQIDMTNKTFNKLIFLKDSGKRNNRNRILWLIKCYCGNEFLSPRDSIISGDTTSCGCYRKKIAFEKRYNPNLSKEDRERNRGSVKYNEWRNSVYDRDNYRCIICGNNNIQAHHLDGWNWCKEKRYDIENGLTLCKFHHNDFHKKYGRGNNTKEQFNEYLKL